MQNESLPESTPGSVPAQFSSLGLSQPLLDALETIGYETPSPIQKECIEYMLQGNDVIGQAQTGTGKTAAFALPLLNQLVISDQFTQILILTPTRELAIQVSEATQSYGRNLKGLKILPIYGGQSYEIQLRGLKNRVHAVVGTPGRVIDHIKRGTLKIDRLRALVLDEADEMLRMGFIDDVQWIMEHTPSERQIALFSATMPMVIRKVAEKFLNKPRIIKVQSKTTSAITIRQRYWRVSGLHKLDALTRLLEAETFDGILIFTRTKTATVELADKLSARGFRAEAINGDMAQKQREYMVKKIKNGETDLLVATDVAARGLDVERISHVINYDIPGDPESYVHRIGRTGRAGRSGEAIIFVSPREMKMLKMIEQVCGQKIEPMIMPKIADINNKRISNFKQKISDTLGGEDLNLYKQIIQDYKNETNEDSLNIAAALFHISQSKMPLLLEGNDPDPTQDFESDDRKTGGRKRRSKSKILARINMGKNDKISVKDILDIVVNTANTQRHLIGNITIQKSYTVVELPADSPKHILEKLERLRASGFTPFSDSKPKKKFPGERGKSFSAKKKFEKK